MKMGGGRLEEGECLKIEWREAERKTMREGMKGEMSGK